MAQGPNKYVNDNKNWWTWKNDKVTKSPSKAMEWQKGDSHAKG